MYVPENRKKKRQPWMPLTWPREATQFLNQSPPDWINRHLLSSILVTATSIETPVGLSVRGEHCTHFGPEWRKVTSTPDWVVRILTTFVEKGLASPILQDDHDSSRGLGILTGKKNISEGRELFFLVS